MAFFDFIKGTKFKKEAELLRKDLESLKSSKLSIEQMEALELEEFILSKNKQIKSIEKDIDKLEKNKEALNEKINKKQKEIDVLKQNLLDIDEQICMESYGLYTPKYDFASSIGYKAKLDDIRTQQKQMIKDKTAVKFFSNWEVDGSRAKGRKMNNDNIKLILRSFNNECEAAINKVKYSNLDIIKKRIQTSYNQLNKLNESVRVSITPEYLDLKIQELYLAFEYEQKKQKEKEELREQREREKEEKALQKEIHAKKKIIDKDINHFKKMIDELHKKLQTSDESEKQEIQKQILEIESNINDKEAEKEELDYRNAHATAGYVYIISNVGSFGPDIVKIGVTRRLDPLERIAELSSASVPFKFDIHALIFSYEAYQLEANLHSYFAKQRINKINNRKEFFKIPIDSIEKKLEEYKDLTIDFQKKADAEEYYQSLAIQKNSNS
ncbi:DUF4041 domain-containing protein [Enterococcus faecium]|uniref:DUF4041 domain-containing protein n=1 Tax=Enterococcus faecium TaxID=1352 RepID=A0A6A8NGT5_ENTFC|nr:DUF4041 domain-containing protein [Enterococcus faecium]MBD9707707.1 DUF4041 domain-containing protein [Enterococcus faecium]MTD23322.1 DUF4041 domain-containing protein [Enterococcus faecium]MTD35028.1 DUF4041 domain-containing protein [Enterococcus faecium]